MQIIIGLVSIISFSPLSLLIILVMCYVAILMVREFWWRVDTCICMGESLHCSSETVTILLTGCPQEKNKRSNYKKQNCASSVRGMSSNPGCGIRIPCFKGQS